MHQNPSDTHAEPLHRCAPPRRAGAIGGATEPPRADWFFVCDSYAAGQFEQNARCEPKMHHGFLDWDAVVVMEKIGGFLKN
jgi:hypothetical protein